MCLLGHTQNKLRSDEIKMSLFLLIVVAWHGNQKFVNFEGNEKEKVK